MRFLLWYKPCRMRTNARGNAAEALRRIGTPEAIKVVEDTVSDLLQSLRDQDVCVPRVAAEALGEIGSEDAVPTLIQVLQDENVGVRRRVARALGRIGTPEALKAVKDFQ